MRMLQLKWSDEPWWKDFEALLEDESPQHAIERARNSWRQDRARYKMMHDAKFRVIEVIAE